MDVKCVGVPLPKCLSSNVANVKDTNCVHVP